MSFTDKVANGLGIMIIQSLHPCQWVQSGISWLLTIVAGNVESLNTLLVCKYPLECTVAMIIYLSHFMTLIVVMCMLQLVYMSVFECESLTFQCLMFYVGFYLALYCFSHYFALYSQNTGPWLQMVLSQRHGDRHCRCGCCCSSLSRNPSHLADRNSPTWVLEFFETSAKKRV